jgi:hypothetical protein
MDEEVDVAGPDPGRLCMRSIPVPMESALPLWPEGSFSTKVRPRLLSISTRSVKVPPTSAAR